MLLFFWECGEDFMTVTKTSDLGVVEVAASKRTKRYIVEETKDGIRRCPNLQLGDQQFSALLQEQ